MSEELKQAAQQALEALRNAQQLEHLVDRKMQRAAITTLERALTQRPAAQATPEPVGEVELAFDQGWRMAAEWANRDDLIPDMDSPHYAKERSDRLASLPTQPAAQEMPEPDDAQRRFEAGCVVLEYLRDIGAPYRAVHHMLIALHGDPEAKSKATPEPVGEALQFPPMPEGWPARFRCDSCDGNGELGELVSMGDFQPPERQTCPDCGGRGWTSEEHAFNADHLREFAEAHALLTRPAPGVPEEALAVAERIRAKAATPEPVQPRTFDARNAQFREHNWQIRFDAAVDARRLARERLYSERERHTAEVKRLQLEIGRLTATPEPVGEAPIWNSIQIASWIGSQLMHEPAVFERAAVCKFVRSLGRHATLLKHSPQANASNSSQP